MKKYNIIYADPAWQQKAGRPLSGGYKKENGVQVFNPISDKSADLPYDTMKFEDILNLPISDLTADNCHLYLWVTNKYLMKAEQVINAWGFKYSTTLVWAKKPIGSGMGGTFKVSTEFLIFATKGKVADITKEKVNGTFFEQKRQYVNGYPCHSKKPDFFYELIEKVSAGEKLELFARNKREGWDAWGNEIESSLTLGVEEKKIKTNCV